MVASGDVPFHVEAPTCPARARDPAGLAQKQLMHEALGKPEEGLAGELPCDDESVPLGPLDCGQDLAFGTIDEGNEEGKRRRLAQDGQQLEGLPSHRLQVINPGAKGNQGILRR